MSEEILAKARREVMSGGILTEAGRLKDNLLPAVYFDSSVVIDYWMTQELEKLKPLASDFDKAYRKKILEDLDYKRDEYLKSLLKSDVRLNKVAEIKQKLNSGQARATAVISPICLLELAEWHAEARFKQAASEATGVMFIQRKSKKEIGDYLSKLFALINKNVAKITGEGKGELELFLETLFPTSYAESIGLKGLVQANIVNFNLFSPSVLQEPVAGIYAYIQVGTIDIMHILIAKHLGCNYIASFDTDFHRARQLIKTQAGIELLSSPEEILNIL